MSSLDMIVQQEQNAIAAASHHAEQSAEQNSKLDRLLEQRELDFIGVVCPGIVELVIISQLFFQSNDFIFVGFERVGGRFLRRTNAAIITKLVAIIQPAIFKVAVFAAQGFLKGEHMGIKHVQNGFANLFVRTHCAQGDLSVQRRQTILSPYSGGTDGGEGKSKQFLDNTMIAIVTAYFDQFIQNVSVGCDHIETVRNQVYIADRNRQVVGTIGSVHLIGIHLQNNGFCIGFLLKLVQFLNTVILQNVFHVQFLDIVIRKIIQRFLTAQQREAAAQQRANHQEDKDLLPTLQYIVEQLL